MVVRRRFALRSCSEWQTGPRRQNLVRKARARSFGSSKRTSTAASPAVRRRWASLYSTTARRLCEGKAIREQVTMYFSADENGPKMDLLLLNLSFSNSSTVDDPDVKPAVWGTDKKKTAVTRGRAPES